MVAAARTAAEKYTDYKVALADGYKIFLPNLPQKQYHFTNYRYAFEAAIQFNPEHPTSLLYEKNSDGYKLIGVMYTAPKNSNWNELDERIPLSIAQWHAHINMCLPPPKKRAKPGDRTRSSVWPARSPPETPARPPAGNSCRRYSAGWCTCIPLSRSRKISGRLSARRTDHMD